MVNEVEVGFDRVNESESTSSLWHWDSWVSIEQAYIR